MVYAIIKDNVVENIAESSFALNGNWVAIPFNANVSIGDVYRNHMFYDPDDNIRLAPEVEYTQKRIDELEAENILKSAQIQTLSDRNDFLEDCIEEIACKIYA